MKLLAPYLLLSSLSSLAFAKPAVKRQQAVPAEDIATLQYALGVCLSRRVPGEGFY